MRRMDRSRPILDSHLQCIRFIEQPLVEFMDIDGETAFTIIVRKFRGVEGHRVQADP